nr:pyroglutamyl-peptidase 1 [Quercus suber]
MAPQLPECSDGISQPNKNGEPTSVTVLVTGFGPFDAKYPLNPSYEIAKALPETLPPTSSGDPAITIIPHASPIRVAYADVHELLPKLLRAHVPSVDLVLHIGMASGRTYYAAERYAHTLGYTRYADIDGKFAPSPADEDSIAAIASLPQRFSTSLDCDALLAHWRESVHAIPAGEAGHEAEVRLSEDAGRFLCDYTYCTSLKWFARRNGHVEGGGPRTRPVLFFHVPPESDEKALKTGGLVAPSLIRAMARCLVVKEQQATEREGSTDGKGGQ